MLGGSGSLDFDSGGEFLTIAKGAFEDEVESEGVDTAAALGDFPLTLELFDATPVEPGPLPPLELLFPLS